MGLLQEMQEITKEYARQSEETVKYLCEVVGVEYREPEKAFQMVTDFCVKGYHIKIEPFNSPGVETGQHIFLTDLAGERVIGYKITIDFKDFKVWKTKMPIPGVLPVLQEGGVIN